MSAAVEAVGQQPDADVEQQGQDVRADYPSHRSRFAYPVEEVLHAFSRDELDADEQQEERNEGLQQEIDEERPGDVVAVLPGIGETETADVAVRHDVDEQVDADVEAAVVAEAWYYVPAVDKMLVGQ